MKKRIISIAAAVVAAASLCTFAGCGSGNNDTAQATTAAAESAAQGGSVISAADAVFSYNGASVELNSDADAAVAALGEAKDVSSQMSCHGQGDDKTYTYDGFVLNTYPLDGADRVLEVVINQQGIPTSKGVQVGDSVSAVTDAYGTNYKAVGMYYSYDAGDGKSLQFFIENDAVKEIDYYYDV